MLEYLAMGGHAAFVWPALGLVALVLIGLLIVSLRQLRAAEGDLSAMETRRQQWRESAKQ
jgi:heme exporter protein D